MPFNLDDAFEFLSRRWRPMALFGWLVLSVWLLSAKWSAILGFGLGDTDDNMRMMQVRGLLEGQGWYDLRQYRLNPPYGADIHWSRVVDLPIAAIKILLRPLIGGAHAEMVAVAVAPLLPMLVAVFALSVTVRRLVDVRAYPIAIALIACAGSTTGMWSPLRIDHHGWQLAMIALSLAALTDPKRGRGGFLLGAATALSLTIGLEMLLYQALAGIVTVLRWIHDRDQAKRLFTFGAALGGGCALGFLLFASYANRAPVCDALSPVWLSAMVLAGAISVGLAWLNPEKMSVRLLAALLCGAALAAAFAIAWPGCLGRPEHSSPELERLWLSRVREAMPVWRHGARLAALIGTLPIAGLIGYLVMLWMNRRDTPRLIGWASVALPAFLAAALLLWQTRASPAAQMLAIPGVTGLIWASAAWMLTRKSLPLRVGGVLAAFIVFSGLATGYFTHMFPEKVNDYRRTINIANYRCPSLAALRPIALQPRGMVLTFVDLGPRLITVTPHSAIAGPYHRNGQQIIDVMHAWRGDAANALATVRHYHVDYVLICPNLSESTIYRSEAPNGFYAQLMRGRVPDWMAPIALPAGSPYRMWRVVS